MRFRPIAPRGVTVSRVELTPESLREVRFTERFRGYDAAEVDTFLSEAAAALDELVSEGSEPLAALAAERARLAIEAVRRETLEEITGLQSRRDALVESIADLRSMLADRRSGLLEALALIDSAAEETDPPGRDNPAGVTSHAPAGDGTGGEADDEATEQGAGRGAPRTDSFLDRLERAAARSGEPSG